MSPRSSRTPSAPSWLAAAAMLATALAPSAARAQAAPHAHAAHAAPDTAFAALQARGRQAMGVDQYTSAHAFDDRPDGGRITLVRDPRDTVGTRTIRAHLREVAAAFRAGDFHTPALVHARDVPGTATMAARRAAIRYTVRDLPGGGAIDIATGDAAARGAVHEFLAFQRRDHRAAGHAMSHRE